MLLETSLGDIVIDLFPSECPKTCKNFVRLCQLKYFHGCLFHSVTKGFIVQTGDPTFGGRPATATVNRVPVSKGGDSAFRYIYGEQARFFSSEPTLRRHDRRGLVSMAAAGDGLHASQFFFTCQRENESLSSLDATADEGKQSKHTIFGEIAEGMDVIQSISEAFVDANMRPLKNIVLRRCIVLEDPFEPTDERTANEWKQYEELIPIQSPEPIRGHDELGVLNDNESVLTEDDEWRLQRHRQLVYHALSQLSSVELDSRFQSLTTEIQSQFAANVSIRSQFDALPLETLALLLDSAEAKSVAQQLHQDFSKRLRDRDIESRSKLLEILGDLPSADVKPPENVLFVCKLNPVSHFLGPFFPLRG